MIFRAVHTSPNSTYIFIYTTDVCAPCMPIDSCGIKLKVLSTWDAIAVVIFAKHKVLKVLPFMFIAGLLYHC